MHTTRLNVNEGDSCCVSQYAAHHSKRSKYTASTTNQSKRSSVEGYICNFYYDPIMHVMKNNWCKEEKTFNVYSNDCQFLFVPNYKVKKKIEINFQC